MKKLDKVKQIAKQVRKAFEKIQLIDEFDIPYNHDLGGLCGRATIQLYLACRRAGIKVAMREGLGHAYNEFNGHIIDVTATQFGGYPKVHVRKYKGEKPEFYQEVKTHLSTKSLAKSFSIKQHEINLDKRVVSKYFPGKTSGQRRARKCRS